MRADKSIVVHGRAVDDALRLAAEQLNAPISHLGFEVLQQGLTDSTGQVRIPYELRVVLMVQPPPSRYTRDIYRHDIDPPFTREELQTWTPSEFLNRLETAVANQPKGLSSTISQAEENLFQLLEVSGDLSHDDEPVVHDGDVLVCGNVAYGASIRAKGSVSVCGDVDVAQIYAGRNIRIDGDLLGLAIAVDGKITCRCAQGAYIEAAGQVTVLEHSLHSAIHSGEGIAIGDGVIGGICSAPDLIVAKSSGTETGVPTRLLSGRNNRIREEAEAVRRQATALVGRLSETTRDIKLFSTKEFIDIKGTVEERMKLWAAMSQKVWLNDRLVALSKNKSRLLASIDRDRSARIVVADKVHPQTQIEIDDAGMTVKKPMASVTFSKDYEAGGLRVTSIE